MKVSLYVAWIHLRQINYSMREELRNYTQTKLWDSTNFRRGKNFYQITKKKILSSTCLALSIFFFILHNCVSCQQEKRTDPKIQRIFSSRFILILRFFSFFWGTSSARPWPMMMILHMMLPRCVLKSKKIISM